MCIGGNVNLPDPIKDNYQLLKCPNCGSLMSIDAVYLREDARSKVRIIERTLSCKECKIRIRQYIYVSKV